MEIERYLEAFYDRLEKQFQGSIKVLEDSAETIEIADILRKSKYSVFYTNPFHTLKEGPIYYLGLNPGGSEGEDYEDETLATLKKKLERTPNWCEFTTESWKHKNQGFLPPGQAIFQLNTKRVLEFILNRIGISTLNVENIFCTNLYFYRSLNAKVLQKYIKGNFLQYHTKCHNEFLDLVKPRVIVCNGNDKVFSPFSRLQEIFRSKCSEARELPLYTTFSLKWFSIDSPDWSQAKVLVIGLPHLSRYNKIDLLETGLKEILANHREV